MNHATDRRTTRPARRAGFSFTEVLFAIMILGVGFIMIAAIFPAALTQTRNTGAEANAAVMARASVNYIEKAFTRPAGLAVGDPNRLDVPVTVRGDYPQPTGASIFPFNMRGRVETFRSTHLVDPPGSGGNLPGQQLADFQAERLWEAVRQNMVLPTDQRLAWVPMFRRDRVMPAAGVVDDSPYVQVIVIAAEVRNRTQYDPVRDVRRAPNDALTDTNHANLEPVEVPITLVNSAMPDPDRITFTNALGANRAAPGAFVVISDDPRVVPGDLNNNPGALNGRIFRLGNLVEGTTDTYELAPGSDLPANEPGMIAPSPSLNMQALILGRGYVDPDNPNLGYEGGAQDISVYTTFVRVPGS